jgi:hypothetical protein
MFLKVTAEGRRATMNDFAAYQRKMKDHERTVLRMVDIFYLASRNRTLRWILPRFTTRKSLTVFNTFIGGDFEKNHGPIGLLSTFAKCVSAVCP